MYNPTLGGAGPPPPSSTVRRLSTDSIGLMNIDRCYCFDETFANLKSVANHVDADSIRELQQHVTFGENCQLCHPYVRRMLNTGQTVFHNVLEENPSTPDADSTNP